MAEPFIEEKTRKVALLIDGDNAQPSLIGQILTEAGKYGLVTIRRIYGDWTTVNMSGWKNALHDSAIQPIQQFRYTIGKNATDSAMIIDAMDLLYTENLDGFCVVSSDSDFTRLAARLREDGKLVLGFGQRKTPKPFVAACDKFIYTEILRESEEEREGRGDREPAPKASVDMKGDKRIAALLKSAVEDAADEFGWAYLGAVGTYIANRQPEFDPRNYGYRKLGDLIKASALFEIDERANPLDPGKQVYLKLKAKPR